MTSRPTLDIGSSRTPGLEHPVSTPLTAAERAALERWGGKPTRVPAGKRGLPLGKAKRVETAEEEPE